MSQIQDTVNNEISRIAGGKPGAEQKLPRRLGKIEGLSEKSAYRKAMDVLFEEDIHTVKTGLLNDVVIPTIKQFLADIFIGGIERALFGDSRRSGYRGGSYRPYSSSGSVQVTTRSSLNAPVRPQNDTRAPEKPDWENIVMRTPDKAERVIAKLKDAVYLDGYVTLWQLYDLVSDEDEAFLGGMDYTDMNRGWTNLEGARKRRVGNGWLLVLPTPVELKR